MVLTTWRERGQGVRRIDISQFKVAKRGTSREINRQIALNLVRTKQPISRADLARLMGMRRGAVTLLVNELIAAGLIFEGAKGPSKRGRRPKFLFIDSRRRCVVAIDIRASRTFLMVTDLLGHPLLDVIDFPTERHPPDMVVSLAALIRSTLDLHPNFGACSGIGVCVPGMVDRTSRRVMHAPTLGWKDVDLERPLTQATNLPVHIENSVRACALAQVWEARNDIPTSGDLVFVGVADGVGGGVIVDGRLLRGRHNIAGEIGHILVSSDGPRCSCGALGCWETYVSNLATLKRYLGLGPDDSLHGADDALTMTDVITRARAGDGKALSALLMTGRYLGLGFANIVNIFDPDRIYIGGEITQAWDLIENTLRAALAERALIPGTVSPEIVPVPATDFPRLRGAAVLVTAPEFAAPVVA
jgi:N-acetylglucosamine repressor